MQNPIYSPLPSNRSIRILSFMQGGGFDALLLHVVSINDAPAYNALSYTWGKATSYDECEDLPDTSAKTFSVRVNNESMAVGENLWQVLRELHRRTVQWIWIDAICINQQDISEKSGQVQLMGEIYANAASTIVWLGNDLRDVDAALWLQDSVVEAYGNIELEDITLTESPKLVELRDKLGLSMLEWNDKWQSLKRFYFHRRWYRRAWVLQETTLAKRVEIWNGSIGLDWDRLGIMSEHAVEAGWLSQIDDEPQNFVPMYRSQGFLAEPLEDVYFRAFGARTTRQFWYMHMLVRLTGIKSYDATCEHDYVYSVLGILAKLMPEGMTPPIVPEYTIDWQDLFVSTAKMLLQEAPALAVLGSVAHQESWTKGELPSWCPDLRKQHKFGSSLAYSGRKSMSYLLFSAAGPFVDISPIRYIDDSVLALMGIRVDSIEEVSESLLLAPGGSTRMDLIPALDICTRSSPKHPLTWQDKMEVLWRTTILDQFVDADGTQHHPAPSDIWENFRDAVRVSWAQRLWPELSSNLDGKYIPKRSHTIAKINDKLASSGFELPSEDNVAELKTVLSESSTVTEAVAQIATSYDRYAVGNGAGARVWCANRRLVRTTEHNLLALAPNFVKQRDEIWLLRGTFVPYVLRPEGAGQYSLVGDIYVHGIMHGEWLEGHDEFVPIELI